MSKTKESLSVKGFYRLRIGRSERTDGKIEVLDGFTAWRKNTIVNLGFQNYLCQTLAGMAGSQTVAFAILGTGTAPGATDTSLNGEITDVATMRMAVTPTTIASKTIQFAFTLNSNVITTSHAIANVGLINVSTTNAGTIFAGNTYTSSALATNQVVNGSYQVRFS